MAVRVNRKTISECVKLRENRSWRTRGFSQRHPPFPPCEPAKSGQVHFEAAAQVQGVGAGRLQNAPEQRRLQGPEPKSPAASRAD